MICKCNTVMMISIPNEDINTIFFIHHAATRPPHCINSALSSHVISFHLISSHFHLISLSFSFFNVDTCRPTDNVGMAATSQKIAND